MNSVTAFAPATIANFNVGFDVLGLALNNIGDEVQLTFNGSQENKILEIINGDNLPYDINKNCCSVVIRKMQEEQNDFKGVDIVLKKGFAAGSGLGSSSASSAAAAYGYNHLIGSPFSSKELVAFAAEGERVACGSAHVDNVAPSLLGGLVLTKGSTPEDILELPIIDNLYAVSLYPNIRIQTSESRALLKQDIPLTIVSKQVSLMGCFVKSLYDNDIALLQESLQDLIVEPSRSQLIPKFHEMKAVANQNCAIAFGISGSGPSVFTIAKGYENARKIESALAQLHDNSEITIQTYVNAISNDSGARIIT